MVSRERCAERSTGITCGGLNPYILEAMIARDFAVRHAIERHASRETEIPVSGFGRERTRNPEYHFFGNRLDRGRQVHFALRDRRFRFPRRSAEQLVEFRRWSSAARHNSQSS